MYRVLFYICGMYIFACTALSHISYYSCRKWQLFLFIVLIDICNGDGHCKWLIVNSKLYDMDIVGTVNCITGT